MVTCVTSRSLIFNWQKITFIQRDECTGSGDACTQQNPGPYRNHVNQAKQVNNDTRNQYLTTCILSDDKVSCRYYLPLAAT